MIVIRNETEVYLTSNFTEDEPLWLVGSVFDFEDEIRFDHFIYKFAGSDGTNTDDSPDIDSVSLTPTWVKIKPSNYFAMLDGETSTQTENADTIEIEIASNNFDTVSLLEVEGKTVTIELTDNSVPEVVFTKVFNLQDETEVVDELSYWFSDFILIPAIFTNKIPLFTNATLKIIIDNTGGIAKCGRLVFGRSFFVGDTGYGANLSLESFSSKEFDVFGNSSLVHRDSINLESYEVEIPSSKVGVLKRKAKELDAIPILFVMDESDDSNLENLLTYGFWDSFSMIIPNKIKSIISVTIKGIT